MTQVEPYRTIIKEVLKLKETIDEIYSDYAEYTNGTETFPLDLDYAYAQFKSARRSLRYIIRTFPNRRERAKVAAIRAEVLSGYDPNLDT